MHGAAERLQCTSGSTLNWFLHCLKVVFNLCIWIGFAVASAGDGDYNYAPLGYAENGGWVPTQDTPRQSCDQYAAIWGWNRSPYSYTLEADLPGRWRCQRFYNGTREPSNFTYIWGVCQRNAAPILTGSDWSYPRFEANYPPPCSCYSPKVFDRSVEWCTGSPSCLWYPDNKATECGRTVDALVKITKSSTDPTRLFHQNQICIARSSCDLRCKMDNCNWLKAVLPDFVKPYLLKQGRWKTIEAECARSLGWLADRRCASAMAAYHIETDLSQALSKSGCGSDRDWQRVFDVINTCTAQTFNNAAETWVASAAVRIQRDRTRAACTAARTAEGVDVYINTELKGTTCSP